MGKMKNCWEKWTIVGKSGWFNHLEYFWEVSAIKALMWIVLNHWFNHSNDNAGRNIF